MNNLILTFDLEEWYMAENVKPFLKGNDYKNHSSVDSVIPSLLDKLREKKVQATFFIVTDLIKSNPSVIERILESGHELASHTRSHYLLNNLSRSQLEDEVLGSSEDIREFCGYYPKGFRSPCFSTHTDLDDVLKGSNYVYSSNSIQAAFHDRYSGQSTSSFFDIPIPTFGFGKIKFPRTGGGWFRLYPYSMLRLLSRNIEYTMLYLHPWDFDVNQPIPDDMPLLSKFRHTVNVSSSIQKLYDYIDSFDSVITAEQYFNLHKHDKGFLL
jgi:hypothetical protein